MLTDAEKEACRNATFTKGRGHGYGTPEEGLCPIGAVAVLRGATPYLYSGMEEYTFLDYESHSDGGGYYVSRANNRIAEKAQQDILDWIGVALGRKVKLREFLDGLALRGTAIFANLP